MMFLNRRNELVGINKNGVEFRVTADIAIQKKKRGLCRNDHSNLVRYDEAIASFKDLVGKEDLNPALEFTAQMRWKGFIKIDPPAKKSIPLVRERC